ncbi:MAG: CCC motif membrane protein [Crocinitomicaceae bacterium]
MNDPEFEDVDIIDVESSALPNATAVLVLGILSIVTSFIYGIPGLILGIIGLSLHKSDKALYQSDPSRYGQSYQTSNAGKICSIIGLCLSGLIILLVLMVILIAMSNPYLFR